MGVQAERGLPKDEYAAIFIVAMMLVSTELEYRNPNSRLSYHG